jgi:hypothetical protein
MAEPPEFSPTEPKIHLAEAARLLVTWLDGPINPEKTGPPIDLWLTLLGYTTDPDDPDYETGLHAAVLLAFDLADPPAKPPVVTVTDVVVQGEVL